MQLYLNNSGSRWIVLKGDRGSKRDMAFVLVMPDGTKRIRQADYYESFGNFVATCYRVAGKRHSALAKAYDGCDIRDPKATGMDALPHIFHRP